MYAKVKQLGFTETHISRIANNGENPIILTNESLMANEAAILKLIEIGYDAPKLTRILDSSGARAPIAIQQLVASFPRLKNITTVSKEFTPDEISMILTGSTDKISNAIISLETYIDSLDHLVQSGNFTAKNIANLLKLNSAKLDDTLMQFKRLIPSLIDFMSKTSFCASNISNMIGGSRNKIIDTINTLLRKQNILTAFAEETGFSPSNIASILSGSTVNIENRINTLISHQRSIEQLMKTIGFIPSNISVILHKSGSRCRKIINLLLANEKRILKFLQNSGLTPTNLAYKLTGKAIQLENILEKMEQELEQEKLKYYSGSTHNVIWHDGNRGHKVTALQKLALNYLSENKTLTLKEAVQIYSDYHYQLWSYALRGLKERGLLVSTGDRELTYRLNQH